MKPTTKKVLFFFNHPASPDLALIDKREMPSERLYGLVELRDRGWEVAACDERFKGVFSLIADRLRHYGFNLINLRSLLRASKYDVLLVKDEFSLALTLTGRLLRKHLVYLDSLFFVPGNALKRALLGLNLRLAPVVVCYSEYQARLWGNLFDVPRSKFRVVPYTIDFPFYDRPLPPAPQESEPPYILSIGRDLGRDFEILVQAARGAGLRIKLVTLPYLIPPSARDSADVDILQRVSYDELFRLYAGARMVVVPLKPDVHYPSGIRAVMESLAVGKATIATRTEILEEYIPNDEQNLIYVEAGNLDALRTAILRLDSDAALRLKLQSNGKQLIAARYQMNAFVDEIERLIERRQAAEAGA